jgi:hypothetical protein
MTITDVQSQVEEISQAMVMLDPADTDEMARIGAQLSQLAAHLTESGLTRAAGLAESAATVTAGCAAQEEVPAAVIATVNQALEALQEMLDGPGFEAREPAGEDTDDAPCEPVSRFDDSGVQDAAGATQAVDPTRPEGLTLSPLVDESIVSEFLGRQSDGLSDMEKLILAFENRDDAEALESLKRWFHTLKGEAGLLGPRGRGRRLPRHRGHDPGRGAVGLRRPPAGGQGLAAGLFRLLDGEGAATGPGRRDHGPARRTGRAAGGRAAPVVPEADGAEAEVAVEPRPSRRSQQRSNRRSSSYPITAARTCTTVTSVSCRTSSPRPSSTSTPPKRTS